MPEELLDGEDGGSLQGQPAREGVAKRVEADPLAGILDALVEAHPFHDLCEGVAYIVHPLSVELGENELLGLARPSPAEKGLHGLRHVSLPRAAAPGIGHVDEAVLDIDVDPLEIENLACTHSGVKAQKGDIVKLGPCLLQLGEKPFRLLGI